MSKVKLVIHRTQAWKDWEYICNRTVNVDKIDKSWKKVLGVVEYFNDELSDELKPGVSLKALMTEKCLHGEPYTTAGQVYIIESINDHLLHIYQIDNTEHRICLGTSDVVNGAWEVVK